MFGKSSKPVMLSQDDVRDIIQRHCRRTLGAGASCKVYLVHYRGVECCFKLARPRQEFSFLDEAKVLCKLKGAGGAPQVLGVTGEEGLRMGMLTTFCGDNTFMQLSRVARTDADKLHAALDLCHGLQKVHALGYVHNDIKGDNVMVRRDPEDGRLHVSLIDFGLARRMGVPLLSCHVPRHARKAWMAPEVFNCLPCRSSMDVYSLGHLLKEVLYGCKGYYPHLEEVATRATAAVPRDRPSVKGIAKALEGCLHTLTHTPPPPPPPSFKARCRSFFRRVRKAFTIHKTKNNPQRY